MLDCLRHVHWHKACYISIQEGIWLFDLAVLEEEEKKTWPKKGSTSLSRTTVGLEAESIEGRATSPIRAAKDDRGRTAETEWIVEAASAEDELRIADTKMGAGTAASLSAATVSRNEVAGPYEL